MDLKFKNLISLYIVSDFRKSNDRNTENPIVKLIPMLAMPFIVQTTFLPMMLLGIKFMLMQSIFLGKFAILFWLVNLVRNNIKDKQGHLYSHNVHINHGWSTIISIWNKTSKWDWHNISRSCLCKVDFFFSDNVIKLYLTHFQNVLL